MKTVVNWFRFYWLDILLTTLIILIIIGAAYLLYLLHTGQLWPGPWCLLEIRNNTTSGFTASACHAQ